MKKVLSVAELLARKKEKDQSRRKPLVPVTTEKKVEVLSAQLPTLKTPEAKKKAGEIFEKYGVEPIEELIKLATEKDDKNEHVLPHGMRVKIWSDLASYRAPKMKTIETQSDVTHHVNVTVMRFGTGEVVKKHVFDIDKS